MKRKDPLCILADLPSLSLRILRKKMDKIEDKGKSRFFRWFMWCAMGAIHPCNYRCSIFTAIHTQMIFA